MAPSRSKKKQPVVRAASSDSQSDEGSPSASQSQSQSLESMVATAMKKREEKNKAELARLRQQVEAKKKTRHVDLQRKMDECRRKHEEHHNKLRRPHIDRLKQLLQRKRELEAKMQQYWNQIDDTFDSTIEQYRFAVNGRLEDLEVVAD